MPRSYVKKLKRWNNDDVKKAIDEIKCGKSICKATSKHNMPEGKLWQAIKIYEKGIGLSCRHTGKVGPRTLRRDPGPGTLRWDPEVGPYGGTLRWDPKVGP